MTSTGWLEGGGLSRNQAGRISSHGIPQNPGDGEAEQSLKDLTDPASHPRKRPKGTPRASEQSLRIRLRPRGTPRASDTQTQPRADGVSQHLLMNPELRGKGSKENR